MRAYAVLAILVIFLGLSQGQDYLEGGYVSSGGSNDIRQYFTDPIFSSPSRGYVSSDPAIRQMQQSLDRFSGYETVRSSKARSTLGDAKTVYLPASATGAWHLEMADGKAIDMLLNQSGAMVFGQASIVSGTTAQWATVSGTFSGSSLRLNVVPASGAELYAITVKVGRLPVTASYIVYIAGSSSRPGTAKQVQWAPILSQ